MLGSPTSPYRNWAPPAAHGIYSLFPNDSSIYQPNARYHPTLTHPKDSLFTLTTPSVFHSPIPTVIPQQNPVPVERGITQLELMTKGFNNNNNNNNTKRFDGRNTPNNNNNNNNNKIRWENADGATVKSEVTNRSCSCRHSPSPSRLILPRTTTDNGATFTNSTSYSTVDAYNNTDRKKNETNSGGCSRTNPVTLRSNIGIVNTGNDVLVGNIGINNNIWHGTAGIVIKKEPGNGITPCQVPEVTTSVTPLASVVKLEATSPMRKETVLPTGGNTIPVGIAVARQRTHDSKGSPQAICGNGVQQAEVQQPAISTMALVQSQCEDRLTNGLSPWASTTNQTSALTPPTSTLWQYPALGVEPLPPVGYQLIRDPMTGHFLLIPAASVLWPTYQPQSLHTTQLASHHTTTQLTTHHTEAIAYEPRILLQQPQPQAQPQPQVRLNVEPKRRAVRVKEEKIQDSNPTPQHFMLEPEPLPLALNNCKRSQATSPVSCMTPPPENLNSQSENEEVSNIISTVTVQDASNQTDTPTTSEDETITMSSDISSSILATRETRSETDPQTLTIQVSNSSIGVCTDDIQPKQENRVIKSEVPSPIRHLSTPAECGEVNLSKLAIHSPTLTTTQEIKTDYSFSQSDNCTSEATPPMLSPVLISDNVHKLVTQTPIEEPTLMPTDHVDLSGLELLSNSIEQFESHRVCTTNKHVLQSPDSNVHIPEEKSIDISEETAAETLQLLSIGKDRASFTRDISFSNEITEDRPVACDDRMEVSNDFNRLTIRRNTEETDKVNESNDNMLGGLGLLCALAEQRFMEEVATNVEVEQINKKRSLDIDQADVNRNYKTRKSERECKKFIASKVQQYYHSGPNSPVAVSSVGCVSPPPGELMDAMELNMRMRLAELQRKYREKQKELSKLTPKKYDVDYASSPTKRGPGRPRKKCSKLSLDSPPESPKNKSRRESHPPVLEKIADTRWLSDPNSRLKSSKLDILKPPTLTTSRILTSAKFRPEMKNGNTGVVTSIAGSVGKGIKTPACNVNLGKLGENGMKTKDAEKTEKVKNKLDNSTADKKSAFPSRANHTFGSKPPARLPRPGENESMFWFQSSQQDTSPTPPEEKSSALSPSSPSLFSSSKKRKVGRPKKHLTSTSVATETIVAKKPKSKSSLVGFLLSKSRRLSSSDVPSTFKSANAYAKPLSLVNSAYITTSGGYKNNADRCSMSVEVFPGNENSSFSNGLKVAEKVEEVKSHKILPKLKAEAKVKTWTCGDEDDVIDWIHGKKDEKLTPKTNGTTINKPLKRKPSVTATLRPESQPTKPKIAKKSSPNPVTTKTPLATSTPKTSATISTPKSLLALITGSKGGGVCATAKTNGEAATPAPKNEKKRLKRSESNSSSNQSAVSTESDDVPLSVLSKKNECRCLLTESHLDTERLRALALMGGLFYAGELSPIQPPDVYGIKLDGERGNKPHILTREEVLKDGILEVKVNALSELPIGTRVCAYWSQQYRCLYPGTVAPNADNSHSTLVSVEFDDGDNGRIGLDDIRLLPDDYPIVEYDPNPLQTLGKRRRQASGASCESHSRRASADTTTITNNNNKPAPPAKQSVEEVKALAEKKGEPAAEEKEEEGKGDEVEAQNGDDERNSSKERKRLKKRRRDKLKRLNSLPPEAVGKKRKKKHRCCDEHCRHPRHHRRHRKHKHRRSRAVKDVDKVDADADALSRLSPVLEQLDILEIQQTAIRQLTNENKMKEEKERKKVAKKEDKVKEKVAEKKEIEVVEEKQEELPVIVEVKKTKKETTKAAKKSNERQPSTESRSKMAAFLPARQLWGWAGRGFKRRGARGRGKKEFFKSIQRGKETIMVGDCAVFLSTGRPDRPYIGRIESMWESWGTNMVVKVKWFYHPEETTGCPAKLKYPGALFESPHVDENDVQTISHKCEVMPLEGYAERVGAEPGRLATIYDNNDIYYQAGYYDPTSSYLTIEKGVV